MTASETSPTQTGRPAREGWWVRFTLRQKLVALTLILVFVPLSIYAIIAARYQRYSAMTSNRGAMEYAVRSLIRLCQAQEALTRLHAGESSALDGITGATLGWHEGNQYISLQEIIRDVRVGRGGEAMVFDSAGRVRIHSNLRDVRVTESDRPNAAVLSEILSQARALPDGETVLREIPWIDDNGALRKRLAAFGYFRPYDWIIVVSADLDDVMEIYYANRRALLIVLAVTAVVVILTVSGVARLFMRPIVELTDATDRVAQGDFDAVIPRVAARDEIGRLARAFRKMTQEVRAAQAGMREWNRTLEDKVTARARELETARDRIIEAERMSSLGRMSAIVAHEINNPLSGVLSYIKVCLKLMGTPAAAERDAKVSRYLDNSAREIGRVGDIVKNLLVFSRKTFGATVDKPVNEIVEHAAGLMRHGMQMKNIEFALELKETELTMIRSDASAVEQMLVAMLVNAMDATAEGGRIGIATSYAGREAVQIRVWDTGQGIPADSLPHIFEPFFSGKSETGKNIGMGLSVAWGVAQSHHGHIDVESRIGEGTSFIITLPLRPPATAPNEREEKTV